jgi:hypothetical protein
MRTGLGELLQQLEGRGWKIRRHSRPVPLPRSILTRYPKIPSRYRELIETTKSAVNKDLAGWLVTSSEFAGANGTAFAWNEWERQSLDAAREWPEMQSRILRFWDRHLPIMNFVADGYAYLALDLEDGAVVGGREPEYERRRWSLLRSRPS